MASLINELIEVLDEELEVYKKLNDIADKKTTFLITDDLEELKNITEKEQILVCKITKKEDRRQRIVKDICLVLNKNIEELTITNLINTIDKENEETKKLLNLKKCLEDEVTSLKEKNEMNKKLINQSLDIINFSVTALQSTNQQPQTANYVQEGQVANLNSSSTVFDAKS